MKPLVIILILGLLMSACATAKPGQWSSSDKRLAQVSIFATAADAYTSMRALDNPNNRELSPILGEHPSDARLVGTLAASQLIVLGLAHYFPKLRRTLLIGTIGAHGIAAGNNALLQ